jgi:hypothetical protein
MDRIKFKQLQATDNQSWTIGAMVRDAWVLEHSELPDKELRGKTKGPGSHCFAVYPESFVPTIDAIIDKFRLMSASQKDLF